MTADHGWFAVKEAKLYTRAEHRPKLYVSAFGPQAARVAGRWGDGIWTLGDPESVPEILEAYRHRPRTRAASRARSSCTPASPGPRTSGR